MNGCIKLHTSRLLAGQIRIFQPIIFVFWRLSGWWVNVVLCDDIYYYYYYVSPQDHVYHILHFADDTSDDFLVDVSKFMVLSDSFA